MKGEAAAAARQWTCQQHLLRFFHHLDAKRYEEASELFHPDGVWLLPGSSFRGRDHVLAALRQRPAERTTCHVASNALVMRDDDSGVHMICLLTTYAVESAAAATRTRADTAVGLFRASAWMHVDRAQGSISQLEMAPIWKFASSS